MFYRPSRLEKFGFGARPFGWSKQYRLESVDHFHAMDRAPSNLSPQRETRMIIVFDRKEAGKTKPNANGKTFNIIRVFGTQVGGKNDGQEWNTSFFANNKELKEQVDDLVQGDHVDVTMAKNGKFWNPTGFEKTQAPAAVSAGGGMVAAAPVVNQRFENLKVAVDIMGAKKSDEEPFDYLNEVSGIADMIQDYIDKKGAFQFDNATSEGVPEPDED